MLYIVGLGPGGSEQLTFEAKEAILNSEVIVGYVTYMKLIKELIKGKELIHNGMRQEVERCQAAIDIAVTGKDVAVISSGDAGVYGMAGLVLELMAKQSIDIPVKVIPGVTASIGGAALLGAPLMNDFCHISLSDLMTPWEIIEKRLNAASEADFVICLYNPRSKGRPEHLRKALDIMKNYKSEDTIVGIAKDVGRPKEEVIITTIKDLDEKLVDMTTVVIVGNKETYVSNNRMVTPRGYSL